jgi:hypothetical protein
MKNQMRRIEKLESKVNEDRLTSEDEVYSPIRDILKKLDPEGSQEIDRLFRQYKDNPEFALQMALERFDIETIKQMRDILKKKLDGSLETACPQKEA